jgi:signal transduction histidine kinase
MLQRTMLPVCASAPVRLFWKGVLLAAIPSIFEIVALGFLVVAQEQATRADAWAMHSAAVLDEAAALFEPILGEAVRFRGAMLAQSPSLARAEFWEALNQQANNLVDSVPDNPSQQQRARQIRDDVVRYRAALEKTYKIAVEGGPEAIRNRYRPGGGVEVLEQLRTELVQFQREERRLDQGRRDAAHTARLHQQYSLYLIILLSIAVGLIAVYLFNKSVGLRLASVTRNAERIGTDQPLESLVAGSDEITTVDYALHQAADQLHAKGIAQAHAERELIERADALALVNEDLRQQRQDNEMFIYSVSHDLRSPLVNLEGFSKELVYSSQDLKAQLASAEVPQTIRQELIRIIDVDFEPSLRYVSAAVTQASRIIDALLKLSRVGRIELREEAIDVNALVRTLLDAATKTIRSAEIAVSVADLPPMQGDAAAIGQVFANLINNAIYYRDPAKSATLEIGGVKSADDVSYFVRDNGLGINNQQQAKLFIAFKRFHPQAAKGEGIGLAYVKRVVDRHSGKIVVLSAEGEGSTFTLNFPGRALREQ